MLYRKLITLLFAFSFAYTISCAQTNVTTLADALATPEVKNIAFSFAQFTDVHISQSNENNIIDLQRAVEDVNRQENIAFVIKTAKFSTK